MAYNLFIDTNVYLDYLMNRGKEWQHAENILELAENNRIEIFTSASSLLNLIYVMRSYKLTNNEIVGHVNNILRYSKLANPDNTVFQTALSVGFPDLEDAVQYYTALHIKGIDYLLLPIPKIIKKLHHNYR